MPRGIILDRDGTLIDVVRDADLGVITPAFHPDQLRFLPGVLEGLSRLAQAGYLLAIATNQPGAAKGQLPRAAIERVNQAVVARLRESGIEIASLQTCLHHPEGGPGGDATLVGPCECRKPKAGMLLRIAADLQLDLSSSWMVGDSIADAEAARAAGMNAGLIFDPRRCELCPLRTGPTLHPNASAPTLDALATAILNRSPQT